MSNFLIEMPQTALRAKSLAEAGWLEEAFDVAQQAVQAHPVDAQAWLAMAQIMSRLGGVRAELAMASYHRALALAVDTETSIAVRVALSGAWLGRHRAARALSVLRPLGIGYADKPEVQIAFARVHRYRDELDPAEACLVRAEAALRGVEASPLTEIVGYLRAGIAMQRNDAQAALAYLTEARPLSKESARHRDSLWSRVLLVSGRMAEGWARFENRLKAHNAISRAAPAWDGAPLNGRRLMLYWEQGYGDTIMLCRYLPRLRDGDLSFACQPALLGLLRQAFPALDIVAWETSDVPPVDAPTEFDCHARLMSLPHLLGVARDGAWDAAPYLHAPGADMARWRAVLDAATPGATPAMAARPLRVGLVWQGNPRQTNDHNRSCPLDALVPLLALPGIVWFGLQHRDDKVDRAIAGDTIHHLDIGSFEDTAAVLAQLDLLISVDTAAAHLAGAMGVPVWVMLTYIPEWRWRLHGDTTPWYASARLFRQPRTGDWAGLVEQIAQCLRARS